MMWPTARGDRGTVRNNRIEEAMYLKNNGRGTTYITLAPGNFVPGRKSRVVYV